MSLIGCRQGACGMATLDRFGRPDLPRFKPAAITDDQAGNRIVYFDMEMKPSVFNRLIGD